MNMSKTKMTLALSSLLFLSAPITSVFADQGHAQMKTMQASETTTMKSIETELRGYVKAFKTDDFQMMQQHIDKLLLLNEKASKEIPAKIYAMHGDGEIDHSKMDMTDMHHSQMDHSKMAMADMDHSQMDHSKMDMTDMDHSQMEHSKMDMTDMDYSQMDHSKMDMNSADHDMSAMPSMEGMTSAQHHQHMMYMQGTEKLQTSLEKLADTQDKTEIKTILTEIKMTIKDNQLFR